MLAGVSGWPGSFGGGGAQGGEGWQGIQEVQPQVPLLTIRNQTPSLTYMLPLPADTALCAILKS